MSDEARRARRRHRWEGEPEIDGGPVRCTRPGCQWTMEVVLVDRNRSMDDEGFKQARVFRWGSGTRQCQERGAWRPPCGSAAWGAF